jgi:arginine:agmatine antiporter
MATLIVAGNMIGSGIYLLPVSLAQIGSATILGWVIATVGALLLGAVFAWLVNLRPEADTFSRIGETLGEPAAFILAFVYWVQCWFANVAIALAAVGYLSVFVPPLSAGASNTGAAIMVIWLMVAANIVGPRLVARIASGSLAIGLLPVLTVAVLGWGWFSADEFTRSWNVSGEPLLSVLPGSVVLILWSFLGLETASLISKLVKDPQRNVPRATLGGIALAATVYILACSAIMGIIPAARLATSNAPFSEAAGAMMGTSVGLLIAACAFVKASGTLAGWILVTEEAGRQVLGPQERRGEEHPSSGRGRLGALLATGLLMTLATLATASETLSRQFEIMISVAVVLTLLVYAASCLVLLDYSRRLTGHLRFASQLVAILALSFCAVAIGSSEMMLLPWTGATLLLAGLAWFWRRHAAVQRSPDSGFRK